MKKDTAVLVIDVLVSGADDTLYKQDPAEAALVKKAAAVVDAARAAELPVIFLCDQHIKGVDRELELWGDHGIKGDARPNPEFEAGSGALDFIIPKRRYSGFFGTDLDLTLRELGVTKLIAVGKRVEDADVRVLCDGSRHRRNEDLPCRDAGRGARAYAEVLRHEACHGR